MIFYRCIAELDGQQAINFKRSIPIKILNELIKSWNKTSIINGTIPLLNQVKYCIELKKMGLGNSSISSKIYKDYGIQLTEQAISRRLTIGKMNPIVLNFCQKLIISNGKEEKIPEFVLYQIGLEELSPLGQYNLIKKYLGSGIKKTEIKQWIQKKKMEEFGNLLRNFLNLFSI